MRGLNQCLHFFCC